MSPMVDGWMGDDWFHFGAFRQVNFDYFTEQTTARGEGHPVVRRGYDDYENFRRAGSAARACDAAGSTHRKCSMSSAASAARAMLRFFGA